MVDGPARKRRRGHKLLGRQPGQKYTVASVYERDSRLGELLDRRGVRPGSDIYLRARHYDQTLSIQTSAGRIVLGGPAAEKIWVASSRTVR